MSTEWISVKDSLPDFSETVAMVVKDKVETFLSTGHLVRIDIGGPYFYVEAYEYNNETYDVTHWLRLPEIPENY